MRNILIVSLLILSSCTLGQKDATDGKSLGAVPPGEVSFTEIIATTSSKIKDTSEFEACMRPSVNMCVTQVGNELARKSKSIDFCNEMPDISSQDSCKFGVVMIRISETGDVALCEELSNTTYKESCIASSITDAARATNDPDKCNTIPVVSGEPRSRRDQCYMAVISQNQTSTEDDCARITSEVERSMCTSFLQSRPR